MIDWHLKTYVELTKDELYQILRVRQEVFILEQNIVYVDADDKDDKALHLFGLKEIAGTPKVVAYSRVFAPGDKLPEAVAFGRVLTTEQVRGQGVGKQLIDELVRCISARFPGVPIQIAAQAYLEKFYQDFGFQTLGEPYMEESVVHIDMQRP